jgi:hypothetical protein
LTYVGLKISKIGQLKKSEKSPTISLFPDAAITKKQKIKINKFGFEHLKICFSGV